MPGPRSRDSNIELRVLRGHDTATVREKVPSADVPEAIGKIFQAVHEALARQGVETDGAPFARYHEFGDVYDVEAGVVVPSPITPDGVVVPSELPAGPAAIAVHAGPYETLFTTYEAIDRWLEASTTHLRDGGPWELYITDPSQEPDSRKWLTEVVFPVRPV